MPHQMAILAVDRHEITRAGELKHRLKLFLTGMAGDMNLGNFLVIDVGAAPIEVIDHIRNRFLVARNKLRGENHGVTRFELDCLVVIQGNTMEHREGLTLAAGR